jgi:type V secretory pathway adhesin AidA
VTGTYLWEDSTQDDAVLLTLLLTPDGGISGTWSETALVATRAVALNGTETVKPPQNSFSVQGSVDGPSSLSLTVDNEKSSHFEVNVSSSGLEVEYTPYGGGLSTLDLQPTSGTQSYKQAADGIGDICVEGIVSCGQ